MNKRRKVNSAVLSIIVAISGVGCIVIGILRGEAAIVMEKAIRICLECVGIG